MNFFDYLSKSCRSMYFVHSVTNHKRTARCNSSLAQTIKHCGQISKQFLLDLRYNSNNSKTYSHKFDT